MLSANGDIIAATVYTDARALTVGILPRLLRLLTLPA